MSKPVYKVSLPDVNYWTSRIPCQMACPVLTDSGRYVQLIQEGRFEEAFLTANPDLLKRIEMLVIEIHPKQCNEKAIRALLAENYNVVEEIQGRKSSKPLLFCRKYG